MSQVRDQRGNTGHTSSVATSVGILYRVSSDGQDEENQVPELESHCADRGYRINRRYTLHDKSAYHGEHEEDLAQVLEDVSKGIIKIVVIAHSSRIDRRDPDVAAFYHMLIKRAGGQLESVREPMFGKDDISGRVITMLAQWGNNEYSKTLAGHVRAGHDRIRANRPNGTGLLGRAPFGYEIQGEKFHKVLVPTTLGDRYVPEMFSRIISGESLATVARWLNAEGVPTSCKTNNRRQATQGTWTASTVRQIIRNTAYKGQMRDSNHDVVGTCKAMVSAAVFRQAAERLDKFPKRGPENIANKALLISHLFCATCKSPMYKVTGGAKHPYYRCSGKLAEDHKSCVMLRMDALDALVNQAMCADDTPIMELTLVEGKNYDDEIDLIGAQIKALDPLADDYAERHADLMAELQRLRDLDTTPDEWREEPTGETYGGQWAESDTAGRRALLKDITIYAGKNDLGEAYAVIEINRHGLIRTHIAGDPPGVPLLERPLPRRLSDRQFAAAAATWDSEADA
jgi:DNA invertase Pin-like site-specific DNA recombinase